MSEVPVCGDLCDSRMKALCMRLDELDKRLTLRADLEEEKTELRFELLERAIILAKENEDRHMTELNNFSGRMDALSRTFLTQKSYEDKHIPLEQRLNRIEQTATEVLGRLNVIDGNMARILAIGTAAVIAVVVGLVTGTLHIGQVP